MTLIYLDNFNLVELARKYCSREQLLIIGEQLRKSNKTLIFSIAHLWEISNHADQQHVRQLGDFMESLPHRWIKSSGERIKNEIEYARKLFFEEPAVKPLVLKERAIDIMPPSLYALEETLALSKLKLSDFFLVYHDNFEAKKQDKKIRAKFLDWTAQQAEIARQPGWEKNVGDTFRKRLLQKVKSSIDTFIIDNHTLEKFLDYLISNPSLIKSYLPEFHLQHMIVKNRPDNFADNAPSEIADLEHFSAAPHVDVFSCDKRIFNDIKIAQKKFTLELGNLKILKNRNEVEDFLQIII